MELNELIKKVTELKRSYTTLNRIEGYKTWGVSEYAAGLMGDIGDLQKLILAKKGFSFVDKNVEEKLGRELADCLWSIIVLSDELDIDLEKEIQKTIKKLEAKISDRRVIPKKKTL